ncbi:MAG: M3 family oligoendopeptidase [Roseibacillus sp.]
MNDTARTSPFSDYTTPQPDLEECRGRYEVFHQRLNDASSLDDCLKVIADWDALLMTIKEWSSLTEIRFNQDTQNKAFIKEKEELDESYSKFVDLETTFKQALLDSPFRSELAAATSPHLFALWECNTRSFSPAIEADVSAEAKLASEYTSLTAGAEIEFRGETFTLSELDKFADDSDRTIREEACRASSQWYADNAPDLDRIYHGMVELRHGMALKLGYDNFVEMGYQRMRRIGYGSEDVNVFREEVQREVVPFVTEMAKKQAQTLGIESLKFWDNAVFSPHGNPAPRGDHDWMIERATEMFSAMGHGLPEFFEEMKSRGVMDLKSRKGKAGGGFCDYLPLCEFPFIFANFNGTRADVDVFTHEMGHAFQAYSGRKQAMSDLVWPTTEACEIHSMALEFLTWPSMDLFYGEEAADELRRIHLTGYLMFLPYGVAVDHFQHLVYEQPDATPERNAMWQEMEQRYLPWYQYDDLPSESSGRLWQAKQHIYGAPFYYIDYCLAQTGAMQFWTKSRSDREGTLQAYTDLCRLGGSRNYSDLLEFAGLKSPFQKGCLKDVMADAKTFLNAS